MICPLEICPASAEPRTSCAAGGAAFDALSPGNRRRHIHAVETAKKPETRARRIDKVLEEL